MAGITSTGLGSGLDITGLVSQLVSAEATPATNRLNRREAQLQTELSSLGTLKGALSDFRSSVTLLSLSSTFTAMKATVSDSKLFSASLDSTSSVVASYDIKVTGLAKAHSLELTAPVDKAAQLGTGTLSISVGDEASVDVTIDSSNNTLEGIAKAINDTAGIGVTATILNNGDNRQLSLKSINSGAVNTIKIAVTDTGDSNNTDMLGLSQLAYDKDLGVGAGKNLIQTQSAEDASIIIDGSSTATTSTTNTFKFTTGGLAGVTLDVKSLTGTDNADTAKLDISRDNTAAINAVKSFVNKFNSLAETIKSLTSYDAKTKQAGPMQGDAGIRSVDSQLRRMLGGSIDGQSLSDMGVSVQRDGTLSFDSSKLQTALDQNRSGTMKLFTGTEASENVAAIDGLADRFSSYLDSLLSSKGPLNSRLDSLSKGIDRIDDDRETLNLRLQKLQKRYSAQFNKMDQLLGQLTATSTYLTAQFKALSSNSSS